MIVEKRLTRAGLVALGYPLGTARHLIDKARADGRAVRVPVAIGNGATRLAWATVLLCEVPNTATEAA